MTSHFLLLIPAALLLLSSPASAWCTTAGGVGEHSKHCPSSVDFEACFATCQCYDANDNPTHTRDALCILDECFCVFDACPYGRLLTSPLCCTKGTGGATINCNNYCDSYPEDC
eukprot:TRINITY_DN69678_c0_g1_i1.p1 TRINITY_DN69678_c0_g1~~TRINITY_DN69678_c0_g1_i1.p1  ORF type:complete len:114 (+),score=36.28 TRINITY_DN69678_c0_g1_i1:43-384(+)